MKASVLSIFLCLIGVIVGGFFGCALIVIALLQFFLTT